MLIGQVQRRCLLGILLLYSLNTLSQISEATAPQTPSSANQPKPDQYPAQGSAGKDDRPGWLEAGADSENRLVSPFLKHLAGDQKQFWTSPSHLRVNDLKWIAPGGAVTAAFIASDSWWSKQVPTSHIDTSKKISEYGTYSFIGLSGASFLLGQIKGDDHLSEAGLLSGEAALNSAAVAYAFKAISERQRPLQGNGHGDFFVGGASFPSEHAAIAWSVASVWAHEYPGWFSQMAAYGLATAVTVTRVTAQQHFPSDVIVGSALGWYFGRQVYRAHHDPELGGSGWGSLLPDHTGEETRNPDNMASPYVLLDSWIYPALERLIAMGYIRSAALNIRPWTRMECARLMEEAQERLANADGDNSEASKIYSALADEFREETARLDGAPNVGATVESLYSRSTIISGTPLTDGFHFGQTIVNDYGRPYSNGFNNVSGGTGWAKAGPC